MLKLAKFGDDQEEQSRPRSPSGDEEDPAHSRLKLEKLGFSDSAPKLPKKITDAHWMDIVPFDTDKSKIKQRQVMIDKIIPSHPSSVIYNGRSGSGKTQLIVNLLCRPGFYGFSKENTSPNKISHDPMHYFDRIYMFSPTAGRGDDLCKHLIQFAGLKEDDICNDFDISKLKGILDKQHAEIESVGMERSKKVLILLDDVQSDQKFLRSKQILECFIQNRHCNVSTWLCSQSFTKTPRACRLQCNNLFIFPCSLSEERVLVEEFSPPNHSKKEFKEIFNHATAERFNFLHVNMRDAPKTRFRRNLDTILELKK
tara:strand:+ start:1004 stop:1942 length:939 start_codon:yes stop_codon:yes gene_type:complete